MAFRAGSLAKHARTLSTRLSRPAAPVHLRLFSHSSIQCSSISTDKPAPYPIDTLVADVISTNEELAAKPKGRRSKEKELKDYGAELPPLNEWSSYFPWSFDTKARSTVMNAETAKKLAEAFVPQGSENKIVLEAFPGPGVLTRALLDLPKERIKRLIVMEDNAQFYKCLKPLEQQDPRVTVINLSGFSWDAYEQIFALGLLDDVERVDWSQEHPHLQFISHIPAKVHGEQLVSQFFRSIPDQQWLFKYGRIPLNLIMTDSLWQRIDAPLGSNIRCKLSVTADATAKFGLATPPETLEPYLENFWPPNLRSSALQNFVAVNIKPLEKQLIGKGLLDDWDYCLRRLFVQKAKPIKTSLPQLAPGAATLLKKVTASTLPPDERIDPKTPSRGLTAKEWTILVQAFADWPFKPDDLSIDSFHMSQTRQETKKIM
ncbi:S-adenosyl-L-methionine-dependent methyltransferase [Macrolepiota fuliginosa MF-IS2]|uniref:rRNA adenine N(6)-methyltransferase n=1 Tax=Macrolepiota fuliginosa MF-IS2 TaxID=1400762 RepID=A0A9P5XEU0_9AGAR|nr:S-adenosyl-L-methionine-dependent methyltransferase [Macrolepiota fuliginosa MF-IS2]